MNNISSSYATGQDYFSDGNSIFINFVSEKTEPHLHAHDFIEISYVASGSGVHILGDREFKVSKGDLFLINYNIPHEFRPLQQPTSAPLMVYNCVFKPDFIDRNLNDYNDFTDVLHYLSFRSIFPLEFDNADDIKLLGSENPAIENIYKKMYKEYAEKEDGFVELLRVYLTELLITIFRSLKKDTAKQNNVIIRHAKLIERSIQYLEENYSINSKLSDLAAQSFLSPTYFCKLFKDYTGITVSEYIQKIRIEEACNQLKLTDNKIIAIAQDVGYKDIKHFNEVFKRLVGMTPSAYRKGKRG